MLNIVMGNLMAGDPNTVGLVLGFTGALLVTFFGLPPISVLNEASYVEMQVTPRMKVYAWVSRIGLLLIAIGFVFQLYAIRPV